MNGRLLRVASRIHSELEDLTRVLNLVNDEDPLANRCIDEAYV